MAGENLETCGNAISEVLYALKDLFETIYALNVYLGAVFMMALIVLPFYIVFSLKNNNVAKAFIAFFQKKGG